MTRFLLAATLFLAFSAPAFAVSDEQVRQLALGMQNSSVSHDAVSFNASVAGDRFDLTGLLDASNSVALADDVNALTIGQLTSNASLTGEDEVLPLDPVCACGAHLQDDIPLELAPGN